MDRRTLRKALSRVPEGTEMKGTAEVIVKVGAEGGSLTLYGARTVDGWRFALEVIDQAPELVEEDWIVHSSSAVDSLEDALALFDEYPWSRLHPLKIHPDFRVAILMAVEERDARMPIRAPILREWRRLCDEGAEEQR